MRAGRLARVRYLHGQRGDTRTRGDIAYTMYVGVLLLALIIGPLARAIVFALATPDAVALLLAADFTRGLAAGGSLLLAGALAVGRLRGPIVPAPLFALLLGGTDLPRSRAFRRSFWGLAAVSALLFAAAGALTAGALLVPPVTDIAAVAAFALGCALFAIASSVLWLAGQSLPGRWVGAGVALLTAAAALAYVAPAAWPGGWLALAWPATAATWPLAALAAAAIGTGAGVPALLNTLAGGQLRADAERWQAATTAAGSGNLQYAAGLYRAAPRIGRSFTVLGVPELLRDAVAAARTPTRLALGAFASAAGLLLVAAARATALPWLGGAAGALLAYLALGVACDFLRYAADCAAAPALYGRRPIVQAARAAALPAALALICAVPAIIAVPAASATVICTSLIAVAIRASDTAKGDLPAYLLTPIPTPMGDMSAVMITSWQADALIGAAVTGGLLGYGFTLPGSSGAAFAVILAGYFLTQFYRRFARL